MHSLVKSFLVKDSAQELSLQFFVTKLHAVVDSFLRQPYKTASFVSVWYYVELLYMMNIAIFFYPPILIAIAGIIIGIALSIHILRLYIYKTIHYTIQLFLMDIHIAYSLGLTIATVISGATWYTVIIVVLRNIIALIELLLVFAMTKTE